MSHINATRLKIGAVLGIIASIFTTAVAWDRLEFWVPASAEEVSQLKSFSIETRMILLDDKLWELKSDLRDTRVQIGRLQSDNKPVPDWLRDDEIKLERRINNLQQSLKRLEAERQ